MRVRLEWLRAETTSLEAQVRDTCEPAQPTSGLRPVRAKDTFSSEDSDRESDVSRVGRTLPVPARDGAERGSATGIKHSPPRSQESASRQAPMDPNTVGGRRRERDLPSTYSAQCYRPGSSFTDASCGCLGKPKSSQFDLRPTIKIVVGSWYVPPDVQSADAAFDTECACQASWNN
jgi:hypothetical protein